DTSICPGITGSILLTDLNNSGALYSWSNGSVANAISVVEAGTYWVKATTPGSTCSTTDSILVARDCYINVPNVFSPDGDGLNDYFFPRDLLTSGLKSFNMSIYNRWGEKVFTTNTIDGRGWDGRLNGVPQAMGVYVYTIEVEFINKVKKSFQGNVTLMR
ncbi:MAG: gliding motility-associated C-terminal domain-containing protein, partial [Chitinophagaceae bacterium]|nr:gliding motility-associated C-terminal domain-containing protein [Chitinophagaceae bacterium]